MLLSLQSICYFLSFYFCHSPDWFSGFYDFNAVDDNTDTWYENFTIPLYPFDAGTEEGDTYETENLATFPKQPITRFTIDNVSNRIFLNPEGNDILPVGKYTCNLSFDEGPAPTPSPTSEKGGSCVAGNTGIISVPKNSKKKSVVQVRDLQVGDRVKGYDFKMKPKSCKVEAIGSFGIGEVYGNYTSDHYVYNNKRKTIVEHGRDGIKNITDKYDLISDCPLIEDESGVKFGPMDSDFCGGSIKNISWKNYLLLHKAILNVVRKSGTFWFSSSSYNDMAIVAKFAPSVCKDMLRCIKNTKMCNELEISSQRFVNKALTESVKAKAMRAFNNIGSRCKMGSVSATVTSGKSVDESLVGTTAC